MPTSRPPQRRIRDGGDVLQAGARVDAGEPALQHYVVARRTVDPRPGDRLGALTARELEVLALLADGRTNLGVAERLWLTERTVEAHVRSIMSKLALPAGQEDHRRVLAVLTYLGASPAERAPIPDV
jgi:DNA-binding NarL/FixJ family response regulator